MPEDHANMEWQVLMELETEWDLVVLPGVVPLVALGAVAIGALTLLKKWKLRRMFGFGSRLPFFGGSSVVSSTLPSTSIVSNDIGYSSGSIEGGETITSSGHNQWKAPIVSTRKVPIRDRVKSKVLRRPVVTQYY